MDKHYDHSKIENYYTQLWRDLYKTAEDKNKGEPFVIMMPPANVTGRLHIGHALTFTLQDILIRYHRLRGRKVLWQAGVDHAGIATQLMVERELKAQGKTRYDLGRDKFVDQVWEWKQKYGDIIIQQLQRLGASADWDRSRFTMDEGFSAAVIKAFVELYRQGLIYRSKRLVNWDAAMATAISDLEVQNREEPGKLWHVKYLIPELNSYIVIATTRPETIPADAAIAVHPNDERYQHLIGRHAQVPLSQRLIPIIADELADPNKGSGAVKITPGHDFKDYQVGLRHHLPQHSVINLDCTMSDSELVPTELRGCDRFVARDKIVALLEQTEAMVQVDSIVHTLPYSDRSGILIEPLLTDQWFVDAKTLAGPALEVVRNGQTQFVPANWTNTYYQWLENIEPWCISRQIWWGHQIPAWYGPDGQVFVAETEAEAEQQALATYGQAQPLTQDPDVLDTWFSSGLWPLGTLGWPQANAQDLQVYYPTSVLVTGFDIIFFWVARMIMMGVHFTKQTPFKQIHVHALVRDVHGKKMSKTKGNVVDPLQLIEEQGADALRFYLATLAAPGRDIKFNNNHLVSYRHFITKIWNASRYITLQQETVGPLAREFEPQRVQLGINRWLISQIKLLDLKLQDSINHFAFHELARTMYHAIWNLFCDWYVELTKPIFHGNDKDSKTETLATLVWGWRQLLTMLHPLMPFVTEELWQKMGLGSQLLSLSRWPDLKAVAVDEKAVADIEWLQLLISEIRSLRTTLNVSPAAHLELVVVDNQHPYLFERYGELVAKLARVTLKEQNLGRATKGLLTIIVKDTVVGLDLGDSVDLEAEHSRLLADKLKLDEAIDKIKTRLADTAFVSKAPEEVIEENQQRLEELQQTLLKLQQSIKSIAAML